MIKVLSKEKGNSLYYRKDTKKLYLDLNGKVREVAELQKDGNGFYLLIIRDRSKHLFRKNI